jgi:transposase
MPKAYAMDLRVRVLADCDRGMTAPQVAAESTVSVGFVKKLKQRRRATGSAEPGRPGNPRPPALDAHADRLRGAVGSRPDATLRELRDALGLDASLATLCRALQRLRLTVKKKSCGLPSRTGPM